jgi:hypothetical protein
MCYLLSSLTLVGQVRVVVVMPTLAFAKWFKDDHQPWWWTKMTGRSLTALNT